MTRFKSLLIEDIVNTTVIKDKEQYVYVTQGLLIQMLNKVHAYKKQDAINEKLFLLYDTVTKNLQLSLDFIEEFFGSYFNRAEKVPIHYLASCKIIMGKQVTTFNTTIDTNILIDRQLVFVTGKDGDATIMP